MAKTIQQLLKEKGGRLWVVQPDQTAQDAVHIMVERNVSSLLVRDETGMVGIISERDLVRSVAGRGRPFDTTPISEFMTREVVHLRPEQNIDEAMALMTAKRVRHLPVLDGNTLIGMVSMRDLVKEVLADRMPSPASPTAP